MSEIAILEVRKLMESGIIQGFSIRDNRIIVFVSREFAHLVPNSIAGIPVEKIITGKIKIL
jgi:hypothetical protein